MSGSEEPNAIVQVGNDSSHALNQNTNVRATEIEIYHEGLEAS